MGDTNGSERRRKDSARLVWDTKPKRAPNPRDVEFQTAEVVVPNPARDLKQLPLSFRDKLLGEEDIDKTKMNRLIWGDNLLAMQALLAQGYEGKIKLIYIDPPFDSKANYSHVLEIAGDEVLKEPSVIERLAYKDTWSGGTDSYLDMLYPRLQLMKRLLAKDGAIYVHLDWNANAYIRILLDEVLGREMFQNEIIWSYIIGASGNNRFGRKHQTILFYSRSDKYTFNLDSVRIAYSPETIARAKRGEARYDVDASVLEERGKNPGDVWFDDTWADITPIQGNALESVDFDTQKPQKLLERIVLASSNEGDIVADFFTGSGSTLLAAEANNRRWIGCELGKVGLQIVRTRLVKQESKPFLIENIGNYQREMIYLHGAKIHEMQRLVLKLYDAQQRTDRPDIGVKLRADKAGRDRMELVHVGYPDRPVTAKKAEEILRAAEKLDGIGYPRVVFLAWDYEPNFSQTLESRRKASKDWPKVELETRMIPPDIYEYLKTAKDEAEVEKLRDKIQFYEKPFMKLGEPKVKALDGGECEVEISIERYVVFDFPVKKAEDREKLRELAKNNFAVLIDYWSVDWDFDGFTFKSQWQAFRGFGKRAKVVATIAREKLTCGKEREIAVRVVDIFGNDASASVKVKLGG